MLSSLYFDFYIYKKKTNKKIFINKNTVNYKLNVINKKKICRNGHCSTFTRGPLWWMNRVILLNLKVMIYHCAFEKPILNRA